MMVSEIHRQCSRVIIPPEGIRQDFPLRRNIYKFYNPFERLTVYIYICHLGYFHQPFTLCLKINIVGVSLKNGIICQLFYDFQTSYYVFPFVRRFSSFILKYLDKEGEYLFPPATIKKSCVVLFRCSHPPFRDKNIRLRLCGYIFHLKHQYTRRYPYML